MQVLGIDEAGRGPVLGSMFIGGVLVDSADMDALTDLGLKDSKQLTDTTREAFVPEITELAAATQVQEVTANEIDELRQIMSLNMIEINGFATLIEELEPDKVFIDLPEPDGDRFAKKLRNQLPDSEQFQDLAIVAEHAADAEYPIVAAASILAKSQREAHVADLRERYDATFDSGYSHDTATITFLEEYVQDHGELPDAARASWATARRITEDHEQQGLTDF